MSRPALYLHFKNKEAIFRALVAAYYGNAAENVRAGLASEGTLAERLLAAFEGQGGEAIESMMSSPHGMELFEVTKNVAGEEIEAGEAALRGLYSRLAAAAGKGRAGGAERGCRGDRADHLRLPQRHQANRRGFFRLSGRGAPAGSPVRGRADAALSGGPDAPARACLTARCAGARARETVPPPASVSDS